MSGSRVDSEWTSKLQVEKKVVCAGRDRFGLFTFGITRTNVGRYLCTSSMRKYPCTYHDSNA